MEGLILVPGEIIGVELSSLHQLSLKQRAKLVKLQVTDKSGLHFLPCIYAGSTKKGTQRLVVAMAQAAEGGGTVFTPTGIVIKVRPEEVEEIIGKHLGVVHGTLDSLPQIVPIPGFPNVGIKIRTESEHNFKFTANIEKNIKAVAKHAKGDVKTRALIYGPPSSGKTSLADRLAGQTGFPWIVVSPKWLTIGGQGAMSALAFIVALAEQRKFAIMFDDIDELLGLMSGGGSEEEDGNGGSGLGLAAYYFILEAIRNHPMPLIFTAVGRFPVDHIVSQCNAFFSLHFGADDLKQIWREVCPTAKELADEIADENLPLAMMFAVVKQAEMIAKISNRKTPNKDDVKTALTCFGKREENKPGFGR